MMTTNTDPQTDRFVCTNCGIREEYYEGQPVELVADCGICSHEHCVPTCEFCGRELVGEDHEQFEGFWAEATDVDELTDDHVYGDSSDPRIDDLPEEAFE